MALPFPSTPPRRALVRMLGSAPFLRIRVRFLVLFIVAVWFGSAGTIALTARIWPEPNDPTFDPSTNPGVVRHGETLTFIGETPWIGRDRHGLVKRSIGDPIPPTLEPPFVHYGSRVVTLSSDSGQRIALPHDLERTTRRALFLGHLSALLAIAGLFGFASRLLGRFRGPALSTALIARFVAASFIPAGVLGTLVGALAPAYPFALEGTFAAVLAANLLGLVLDPVWIARTKDSR